MFSYGYLNFAQQSTLRILAIIQALLLVHFFGDSTPIGYYHRPAFQLQIYVYLRQLHPLSSHLTHILLVAVPYLQEMYRVAFMGLPYHEVF